MRVLSAAVTALALWAGMASAADERLRYDVLYLGLKAGELEIAARVEPTRYALVGRLESTGLVRAVRKVRYDAKTSGTIRAGKLVPDLAWESADTGKRFSEAEMSYRNGVPQVKVYKPARTPRPEDVDPSTQPGALDSLTALFVALRDVERAELCRTDLRTYDGRRLAQLDMAKAKETDTEVVCAGRYTRLAGYTAEELAEARGFPFRLTFRPGPNGLWRSVHLDLDTLFGRAQLVRR